MRLGKLLGWTLGICGIFVAMLLASCGGSGGGSNGPVVGTTKSVALDGGQVMPAGVATATAGQGFVTVDESSGRIAGSVTLTFGSTATAAQIHAGAAGTDGPLLVDLFQSSPGVWVVPENVSLTPTQVAAFDNGQLYILVQSSAHPNGEIRGQVGRMVFFATLTGAQEVPANASAATGVGMWVFDPVTKVISGTETVTGMTATVSHFHQGPVGVVAPVAIPFTGGPTTWTLPPTTLTDAQVTALLSGGFYANAHSAQFPGGEIRGQVYQPTKCTTLTGQQETPPNNSAATGTGCAGVNPFTKAVASRIETQGIVATLAHIHQGPPGVVSPVIVPMSQTSPGIWVSGANAAFTDAQLNAFITGGTYLNVHSAALPVGEIRGQLVNGQ
ncbi:MAG TPA: CHRD domain-containing protein [Usitatibacter sp.]|nr:CHRD domain-containing protein [Usitatibacter sp.]